MVKFNVNFVVVVDAFSRCDVILMFYSNGFLL